MFICNLKNLAASMMFLLQFAELFKDIKKQTSELEKLQIKQVKEPDQETSNASDSENHPPKIRKKYKRRSVEFRPHTYNTRNRAKNSSVSYETEDQKNKRRARSKLKVLFPWAKSAQRHVDMMKVVCDVDEEQEEEETDSDNSCAGRSQYRVRRHYNLKARHNPASIPSVDEITQEMLDNIAETLSRKTYCKATGTSCHQCRQKTLDTKTICRSGECIGVRGQFCGPCLRLRYGENAADALKDPVSLYFFVVLQISHFCKTNS